METEQGEVQWQNKIGLLLGIAVFVAVLLVPSSLTAEQHRLLAVLTLVFTFWVTEALPLPATALLGVLLCVLLGIVPVKAAFASFGNPILFLFFGAFVLAEAVKAHGLDRRWTEWLLSRHFFTRTPFRIMSGFGLTAWIMSAWMSNSATTATLYPLAWKAFQEIRPKLKNASPFGIALLLTCAYASSIGGIVTPVGSPPNLIGIGFLQEEGVHISFLRWMLIAAPIAAVMLLIQLLWVWWLSGVQGTEGKGTVTVQTNRLGTRLTMGELNTAFAFGLAVSLWVLSGLVALILGADAPLVKKLGDHLPEALPALLGALLLFVLPIDRKWKQRTITWREAQRIDWGVLLLFGGGLALGDAISETGLAKHIGAILTSFPYADSQWGLTAWCIAFAVLLTVLVSNTAAVNILAPMVIAAAKVAGISPLSPVLGATIGCSLDFMLPVGTPPNAIVYASGLIPLPQMMRIGMVLNLTGIVVVWLMLRLLCPIIPVNFPANLSCF